MDYEDALLRLEEAQMRMLAQVQHYDYAGCAIDEMIPLSLPFRG